MFYGDFAKLGAKPKTLQSNNMDNEASSIVSGTLSFIYFQISWTG